MRDDRAQMMLLTAIILLLGFVALAGMVARVAQVPQETLREQRAPIIQEMAAVTRALDDVLGRLADDMDGALVVPSGEYLGNVTDALTHIRLVEASRGYQFRVLSFGAGDPPGPKCDDSGAEAVVWIRVALGDGLTELEVTASHAFPDTAVCTAPF